MQDLNDLMIFKRVVEHGSFTKAANSVGLPKSNISRKVSRLEEQLGVRLLERSTRSLSLTEVGSVYFKHCQRIAEELESAEYCLEALTTVPTGVLSISCSVGIGQELLAYHLAQFKLDYPLIDLRVALINRRVDIIDEGFDLVIRVGESTDSNLISKRLLSVEMHLYASNEYLKQNKPISEVTDLEHHQCLYMNALDNKPRWELYDQNNAQYVEFNSVVSANDFFILKTMAEQNLGVVLLPDYFVEPSSTNLKRVLPNVIGRKVNIYAIYPSRFGITPKVNALLDFLSDNLSG